MTFVHHPYMMEQMGGYKGLRDADNQIANELFFLPFAMLIFGKKEGEEEKKEKQVDTLLR